ncbi:MAG: T9SS type A sorting domain-containing protein [Bacteroidetes bacterium]|nr:T9SS type A sorting domain-containing protein [Bacteroidota bacterium]
MTDLKGALILETSNLQSKQQLQTIDVSILKQGMYLLRVANNNTVKTIKFIKR